MRITIIVTMVMCLIGCFDSSPEELAAEKTRHEEEVHRLEMLPVISSVELSNAYHENEVAADEQFKNKKIKVSGIITSINKDILGNPFITMLGSGQYPQPQFAFSDSQLKLVAGLKKGMEITLICFGSGYLMNTPVSDGCQLPPSEVKKNIRNNDDAVTLPISIPDAINSPIVKEGKLVDSSNDAPITTSIGKVSYKNKPNDVFGNNGIYLDNKQILFGLISEDLRIEGVSFIDYNGRITLLITTYSGGMCCLVNSVVHLGRSGNVLSSIELSLSRDYDPDWKEKNGTYISAPFNADGSVMVAVLSQEGVSLRALDVGVDKSASNDNCEFMSKALNSSCKGNEFNKLDCSNIEASLSNAEASWFNAASDDPGFDFKGFMQACQNVCMGQYTNTKRFADLYCHKKNN